MSTKEIYEQLAGQAAMRLVDGYVKGEPWAVEAFKLWKETGEAPVLKIDRVEEVRVQ